ncbi:unnamed protein product [Camellia sinensis]
MDLRQIPKPMREIQFFPSIRPDLDSSFNKYCRMKLGLVDDRDVWLPALQSPPTQEEGKLKVS